MRRLVVALDYGTSNSGAAYAIVHDDGSERIELSDDDIGVVRDWPRAGGSRDASEKVPSESAYDRDGRPVGHGFEASRQGVAPLQWMKLLLEPQSFKEKSDRTSKAWASYDALGALAVPKRPVEVVGDYLRWLWARVQDVIRKSEGEDEDTDLFDPSHLTVVITVPASWSAPAKQRMASAAVIAGIPEHCIKTLAEPEAAAVYGLKRKARKRDVDNGDCVIILDAGGGTVDAVAYQIRERSPLSLRQVTESKGDFCGSTFINKDFNIQLRSILGDRYHALSQRTRSHIDEVFEFDIKRGFNPFADRERATQQIIPVNGLRDDRSAGIRDGWMTLEASVVPSAFDSVMTQIMTLLDQQIAAVRERGLSSKLKGILLVGGFSKSEFLYSRIKQEFSGKNDPKVWRADESWTAVARGAVACEASALCRHALIHSRLSANNYGIPYMQGGEWKVHWLVRKGASVKSNMPTEPYGLRIDDQPWLDADPTCLIYVPIVASSDDHASDAYTDRVAPHVEIECRVRTALRFAPGSTELHAGPRRAWHVPATLVLYFDGALISFKCRVGDEEVGVASVRYFDFHHGPDGGTEEDLHTPPSRQSVVSVDARAGRKDSKVSFANHDRSEENILAAGPSTAAATEPRLRRHRPQSAPNALDIGKETGAATTPTSPLVPPSTNQQPPGPKPEKKAHHFFPGLRTKRDTDGTTAEPRSRFLAPGAAMDLPPEDIKGRLDRVYQKGWEPRKDHRRKGGGGGGKDG